MSLHTVKKPRDKAGQKKGAARGDTSPKGRVVGGEAPGGLGLSGSARMDGVNDETAENISLNRAILEQSGELKGRRKKQV